MCNATFQSADLTTFCYLYKLRLTVVGRRFESGKALLECHICSDGRTKELTDIGIQHFLANVKTAEGAARSLVKQALDKVTVIVIDVHAVGDVIDTGSIEAAGIELD